VELNRIARKLVKQDKLMRVVARTTAKRIAV
jgi:hypothetical protein